MLRIGLQFFAHKKGVGSTKNGRDSEAKRLGVKKSDGQAVTGRQYNCQTERNQDSSRSECRTRLR